MTLEEARKLTDLFTAKASDLTSQLAFAGIAVVWIFKTGTSLPPTLRWPLWLFVLCLFFHYLQYILAGFLWDYFTTDQEKKYGSDKDTKIADSPNWINLPHSICYILKIFSLFLGYAMLLYGIGSAFLN